MPALSKHERKSDSEDAQPYKTLKIQRFTRKCARRRFKNYVKFRCKIRQSFDEMTFLLVNCLTHKIVFERTITNLVGDSGSSYAEFHRSRIGRNRERGMLVGNVFGLEDLRVFADLIAQLARYRHRLQRGVDHLGRARLLRRVLRLGLEQLGVRENHAELVIEFVQQLFRAGGHHSHDDDSYAAAFGLVGCFVPSGSRHNVSTKMRMLPPAVRRYSTLLAAIQL